ncbi:MAG: hypothetical protein WCP58_10470 [bacterium]
MGQGQAIQGQRIDGVFSTCVLEESHSASVVASVPQNRAQVAQRVGIVLVDDQGFLQRLFRFGLIALFHSGYPQGHPGVGQIRLDTEAFFQCRDGFLWDLGPPHPSAASAVTREKTTALESNHSEGCALVAICPTLIKNTLPGSLVESFKGGSLW